MGVVLAQYAAAVGEGVLIQCSRCLVLTDRAKVDGQAIRGVQGERVIIT